MDPVTTPSGLVYEDLTVGGGATAKTGSTVQVHYTGWLTNGDKFDSSKDRRRPFSFPLGRQHVIAGWDEGVQGMQVGGVRLLPSRPDWATALAARAASFRPMPRWCLRSNCWK